jgi:hypothetical protein
MAQQTFKKIQVTLKDHKEVIRDGLVSSKITFHYLAVQVTLTEQ